MRIAPLLTDPVLVETEFSVKIEFIVSIHKESSDIDGEEVGVDVGRRDGFIVGVGVGLVVRSDFNFIGALVGLDDGILVDCLNGCLEGWVDGCLEGWLVGLLVGCDDGCTCGCFDGTADGAADGSLNGRLDGCADGFDNG